MSDLWIPAESDLALTLREPRLLVPGNKPLQPVRIDWSNPLTEGLYSFYAPEFGVDLATGLAPTINGDPGHVGDHDGLAWDLVSGSSHYIDLGAFPTISAFTTGVIAKALSGNAFYLCSRSGSTTNGIDLLVNSSATGVSNRIGTTTTNSSTPIWTLDIEEYQHITAGWTTGSKHSLYIRGDLVNQSASAVGGSITHTQNMRLSSRGALYLSQRIKLFYFFARELSADELVRFVRNPMQILRSANDTPFRISVPAGGGATLTVQSAMHSHSAASPSLVQANTLTPVDALHSHAAELPSLTQANALNPSDSAHDHSAEQPSLSSASLLAASDALHGHMAEQPSVIQAHVLAVVSATHAHTADNVTLTVGGTLVPDDALHGHLVDAPTLTQAGVLAPAGALHAHTAEPPSLVQANSLSPDDAAHAHSAEQPTLDLSVFVSAADSTHSHAADSPALTQANLLAVVDAVHAHLADSPALSQHITVVASDALHAHLSESPNIVLGTLPLMSGRVYLSRATLRVYRPVKRLNS